MARQVVSAIHVLFVAPLLTYVGYYGKHTPQGIFNVLLALGIVVGFWHFYLWVKYASANEGFQSSYLGIPYNWQPEIPQQHAVMRKEGFLGMPFSFPYQDESSKFHSFHDSAHSRQCNGKHCQHQTEDMEKANTISNTTAKEGFMNPNENPGDDYGMMTVTPYNHNNPKFGSNEEARFLGDKNFRMSKHVCTGSPNCDECCYSIRGNKNSPEYSHCMSGCIQGK